MKQTNKKTFIIMFTFLGVNQGGYASSFRFIGWLEQISYQCFMGQLPRVNLLNIGLILLRQVSCKNHIVFSNVRNTRQLLQYRNTFQVFAWSLSYSKHLLDKSSPWPRLTLRKVYFTHKEGQASDYLLNPSPKSVHFPQIECDDNLQGSEIVL